MSTEIKSVFQWDFVQLQNSCDNNRKDWIKLLTKRMQLHNKVLTFLLNFHQVRKFRN